MRQSFVFAQRGIASSPWTAVWMMPKSYMVVFFTEGTTHGNTPCNNCRKFGLYYHEKDDCCEKPSNEIIDDKKPSTENFPGMVIAIKL